MKLPAPVADKGLARCKSAMMLGLAVMDDNVHIDFDAPATLRKWPSIKNERASSAIGTYLVIEGTLDHCIRQFMAKPVGQHHLYEIHTAPQGELVSAVLTARLILEIARLRDLL